jgi:hypothetical protein
MEAFGDMTLIAATTGGGGGGGGGVTVRETTVLTPLALAVICVEPGAKPAATPSVLPSELTAVMDATYVFELDQAKEIPDIAVAYWSYPTALNCWVLPA